MDEKNAMTISERRKYIQIKWETYRKANKGEKKQILDEIEEVTGMHRKSIIRILTGKISRKKRQRERGKVYGIAEDDAIRTISRCLDYPCAERLQPSLVRMAKHLEKHQELEISQETLTKLATISVSTVKRILKRVGKNDLKLAFRKPHQSRKNHLRKAYPMKRIPWNIPDPGHFEVDLVLHCGDHAGGEYIHTLQMVDVATGWSEIAACYGRSYKAIQDGFQTILNRLPFPIREIHPDNGVEFFNQHLLRFWDRTIVNLEYTRSRPYHKNDNRFVEENNHSLIRAYLGHSRYDSLEHLQIIRKLFDNLWIYHNLFQPVMRTKEKLYIDTLHYRRVFDQAIPPLDRLLKCSVLSEQKKDVLVQLRNNINPLRLRNEIEDQITELHALPSQISTKSIDVRDTLQRKELVPSVTLSFEPTS